MATGLGALAAIAISLLLLHHPMLFTSAQILPGDVGDTRFNHLILEHGYRWLTGDATSLWNVPMFYPATNVLAFSDVMLGVGAPYFLARAASASPDAAMWFWYLATTALNAGVFFAFCRRVPRFSVVASAAAAILFAAGAARANQLNHPQLLPMYFPVLAIWAALRVVTEESVKRRRAWMAALLVSVVAQLWGAFYIGWFTVLLLTIAFATAAAKKPTRQAIKRDAPVTALMLLLAGVLLIPLGTHYLAVARELGVRPWSDILLPRVQTWLNVGHGNWLWSFTNKLSMFQSLPIEGEQRFGVGVITTVVMLAIAYRLKSEPWVRAIALFTLGALAVTTLWRFGFAPWWLIYKLFPGGSAIRAVPRIGVFLLMPAALAVALLIERRPKGAKGAALLAVGALCLLEQGTESARFEAARARANANAIAAEVPKDCAAFLAVPPIERMDYEHNLDAAWAAMETGVPTVNGYSGNAPRSWPFEKVHKKPEAEAKLKEWTGKPVCVVEAPKTATPVF